MNSDELEALLRRLASRSKSRTEADVQSDVKILLSASQLSLDASDAASLEVPLADGTRRRIDVEVGHTVIEVKRDLRKAGVIDDAIEQLSGYVHAQAHATQSRYVGILTDGAQWLLYHPYNDTLVLVAEHTVSPAEPDPERLLVWLEGILATAPSISPTPDQIELRLGASSPAYLLDHATLSALYEAAAGSHELKLKRELWAKLLRTALGSAFQDDPDLFVDHTLLVLSAEIIAHAVVGFNIADPSLAAQTLVRGDAFAASQIYGVVEADFFDWVVEVPGGAGFVRNLATRLARFDWQGVDHDVLKVLYESVIDAQTRHDLGEYYTPDWLADEVVDRVVRDPLEERVLDPSCGSGTFLFHAIRKYLAAADAAGIPNGEALHGLTHHVLGVDVHPVSVTLARVTYLMAVGPSRITSDDRGALAIPVYLGDSIQWDQHTGYLSQGEVRVPTAGADLAEGETSALFGDDLVFPGALLDDAQRFDRLVASLADRSLTHTADSKYPSIEPLLNRFGVAESERQVLRETFGVMCRLHAEGRNHIWSYYVRNLVRPLWLTQPANAVDTLVGNPPWLSYRFMTASMQAKFTEMCRDRGLITGRLAVSSRDLSALFIPRVVELYLKPGGHFGFVVPRAVLSRQQYAGFRSGKWSHSTRTGLDVSFDPAWDLDEVRPHLFRVPAAVIFGVYTPDAATPLGEATIVWSGKLPRAAVGRAVANRNLQQHDGAVRQVGKGASSPESEYKKRFRQGAVLSPRVLLLVTREDAGPLGAGSGRLAVKSRRSSQEKKPWKDQASLNGIVEKQFVHATYVGENLLPYRVDHSDWAVLPISRGKIMSQREIDEYSGLEDWWVRAEEVWKANKSRQGEETLLERIDFHNQLSSQLDASTHRVVYTKAGSRLAAARVPNRSAIVDFSLYWAAAASSSEALYLVGILNSLAVQRQVEAFQARGIFGARHFDKYTWHLPVPVFDAASTLHGKISATAAQLESLAREVDIPAGTQFQRARARVRQALSDSRENTLMEELVVELLTSSLVETQS